MPALSRFLRAEVAVLGPHAPTGARAAARKSPPQRVPGLCEPDFLSGAAGRVQEAELIPRGRGGAPVWLWQQGALGLFLTVCRSQGVRPWGARVSGERPLGEGRDCSLRDLAAHRGRCDGGSMRTLPRPLSPPPLASGGPSQPRRSVLCLAGSSIPTVVAALGGEVSLPLLVPVSFAPPPLLPKPCLNSVRP